MALQFFTKVCGCGKTFRTSNNSDKCYDCTLEDITHGNPPEEGDFNTAGIVSGTLTEAERGHLQQDLESVETGRSIQYAEEIDTGYVDSAWCTKCNRDTAFCLCKCYVCEEQLENCRCKCAQCDTPVKGGGLCDVHKAAWDEEIQGPEPDSKDQVGICTQCSTPFNRAFLLNAPHSPKLQCTAYLTKRTLCIKCDVEGRFLGYLY